MTTKKTRIAAATSVAVLALVAGAGIVAAGGGEQVTICHKPDGAAKTMEIPRDAWDGHHGHGDHRGACHDAGPASQEHASEGADGPALSRVTVDVDADGDVDGEADFRITIRAEREDAEDVVLTGRLIGDGDWRVRSRDADCTIAHKTLRCAVGHLEAGAEATIRVEFDNGPRVCREPGVDVTVSAANDDSRDDNRERVRTHAGACSIWRDSLA